MWIVREDAVMRRRSASIPLRDRFRTTSAADDFDNACRLLHRCLLLLRNRTKQYRKTRDLDFLLSILPLAQSLTVGSNGSIPCLSN